MADWDESPSNGTTAPTKGFGRGFGRGVLQEINENNNNKPGGLSNGFGSSKPGGFGGNTESSGGFGGVSSNGFGSSGFGGNSDSGSGFGGSKSFGGGGGGGGRGCFKCGEEGHMSRECPKGGGGGGGRGCFKCGEEGHMSRECPKGGGGGGGGRGCFKCGEEGHMSRECPKGGGGGGGRGCFKCGEEGHMSRECPKGGGGGGGGKGCFKCGEEGHMSRECPSGGSGGNKSGGFGGSSSGGFGASDNGSKSGGFGGNSGGGFGGSSSGGGFGGGSGGGFGGSSSGGGGDSKGKGCFKCGEEGHMSRECPSAGSGGGGNKGCFKCGEEGHMSRECPSAGSGGGGNKGCFKCGEEGHMSRECPNQENQDGEKREIYVPPEPSNDEDQIFKSIDKGINFDKYDDIPVEVSGRSPVSFITSFDEAGLRDSFLINVRKAKYTRPTPVQKYAIPIIMAGRDLMACAQTGSGKTAAFILPTITAMMNEGLKSSRFSEVQEPQAIVVAPTRELAIQIHLDARKFAHGTDLRSVVLYGGTSVGYQMKQVEQGAHFVVGTPGRLLDTINKGKISLAKVKFLILDEADRMLDMGFEPEIRKLVETMGMPAKTERQTLMFSATFPEEIQKLAADFLNDYLFVTVGRVGGANTDVEQMFYEIDRLQKRDKLCSILSETGTDRTLVFVEQKRNADFLASYLSQSGFPTTSIHGDRLQREREEALLDFKTGKAPILVATSVAARGLDIPGVKHVVNYDIPASIDEYVHRIGRTGRCGNLGKATSFYSHDSDSALCKSLVRILKEANQGVPSWLESYAASSMETSGTYRPGGKFGGKDIRGSGGGRGQGQSGGDQWFDGGQGGGSSANTAGGGDEEEWD